MESDINGERFVLVSENLTFTELLGLVAQGFGVRPPNISVPKSLSKLYLYLERFLAFISGKTPSLSKYSLDAAYSERCFNAEKMEQNLNYSFEPIAATVNESCKLYLREST
jgi:hypothetical protein